MKNLIKITTMALTAGLLILALTGCSGDAASPTSIIDDPADRADTAPPSAPTGIMAAANGVNVKISWDANVTDADLAGYMVYRSALGSTVTLTEDLIIDNRFVDQHPLTGACYYAVTALDAAGNESAHLEIYYQPNADRPELEEELPLLR